MQTLITCQELRDQRSKWSTEGRKVAFVPTMGALHDGHLALMLEARKVSDVVISSIFVNPKQFGPNEDFAKYPRTLKDDIMKLERVGVDAVFLPNANDIYPASFQTYVTNREASLSLCGASRPGHFDGVLTVVLKLFNLVKPQVALFGKKDFQQWRLIEMMVRDLAVDMQIIGCETHREVDGLAMSSRNRYLSAEERALAPRIFAGLSKVRERFGKGERTKDVLLAIMNEELHSAPGFVIDYVDIRTAEHLKAIDATLDEAAVMCVAVKLGTTRLIDNIELRA